MQLDARQFPHRNVLNNSLLMTLKIVGRGVAKGEAAAAFRRFIQTLRAEINMPDQEAARSAARGELVTEVIVLPRGKRAPVNIIIRGPIWEPNNISLG